MTQHFTSGRTPVPIYRNALKALFFCFTISFFFSCKKDRDYITPSQPKREELLYTQTSIYGNNLSYLVIMNYKGDTLKFKQIDAAYIGNFQRWNINGQLRYTYFVKDLNTYYNPVIGVTGYYAIADSALNEIRRVYYQPYDVKNFDERQTGLDQHDFILLSDDHYLTLAYYEKQVSNIPAPLKPVPGIRVAAAIITEVDHGQVVWHWDATDFPELYGNSTESNDFTDSGKAADYLHVNSIFIDPNDNNLLVSCRNTNQVLKISRKNGGIMWRLGGNNSDFEMPANRKFLRQHHATLTDNNKTLLLFDNGDINERPYSRVLEFQLNEISKDITGFKSFNIPEKFTQYTGSVQKIGDNYLIGGGTASYILDINYKTQEKALELQLPQGSYRAFKYE